MEHVASVPRSVDLFLLIRRRAGAFSSCHAAPSVLPGLRRFFLPTDRKDPHDLHALLLDIGVAPCG